MPKAQLPQTPNLEMNSQFKFALELVLDTTKNLFITGKAGTGKSTLLNLIRVQTSKNIVVLAPTGLAALNVSGQTIHSFFKFSPQVNTQDAHEIGKKHAKDKVIKNLDLIVIDEISMVRADLLDCVDISLKHARGNSLPFGGVQMVLIGDLYQLPPVLRAQESADFNQLYSSPYFFGATVMQELMSGDLFDPDKQLELLELDKIYRQSDSNFIDLLNAVRRGEKSAAILNQLNDRIQNIDHLQNAIILTTTNQAADDINQTNLEKLPPDFEIYKGQLKGDFKERDLPTSQSLELRVGARVMFVKNDQKGGWVNGTLGVVKDLFEDGVRVISDDNKLLEVSAETWEMYQTKYNDQKNALENESIGSFTQLPLKLAWAITIHKSQGQTFDQVVLDLKHRAFSAGQTYVALSRCRSLEGLYLTHAVQASDIRTDRAVSEFLTKWQYNKSKQAFSAEDLEYLVNQAIKHQEKLEILYLKGKAEISKLIILPKKLIESQTQGINFLGLEAYCFENGTHRTFNFERILEVKAVEQSS